METSVNNDWRDPSDSEKEIITEWRRKDLRARRRFIYIGLIGLVVTVSWMIIQPSIIEFGKFGSVFFRIAGVFIILFAILLIVLSSDLHRKKQFLRGDYQILDSVVMSTRIESSIQPILELKTASGESVEITVDDSEFNAITPGTPGFLFRYGKNAAQKITNTTKFIPVHEAGEQDDGTANQSSGCDWRTPNASEADLIAAWAHKIIRSNRLTNIGILAFFGLMLIASISTLYDNRGVESIVIITCFAILTFWQVLNCFFVLRLKKQLSGRDYLILDVIVVSKNFSRVYGRVGQDYHIQAKTSSGKMMNVKVVKAVYYAVTENTPGFLAYYGKDKPTDQGKGKDFYPALPVEE